MTPLDVWVESSSILHLAQWSRRCTTLGPGVRAVLWVQGCPFRCPGCVAPETLPFTGGETVSVHDLSRELLLLPDVDGLTFSGGEPMAQAAALSRLIDELRPNRDFSFLCYTGYTLGWLRASGSVAQKALLDRLDVLIDGPYLRERHTDLRWRGSDNQQVHFLTPRYRHLSPTLADRGTWIDFEVLPDESVRWMGIPPPGFRELLPAALSEMGIDLLLGGNPHE
jgi:anaerobic ribonucleoside-triphosphate reductase activating protein